MWCRATFLLATMLFATLGPGPIDATCVFKSEFGFTLDCAFKKSALFRVRNLGGVKGFVGVGLSLGDEIGFNQSLSNLENNGRRRSVATPTSLQNRNDVVQMAARLHNPQQNSVAMQALETLKKSRQEKKETAAARATKFTSTSAPPVATPTPTVTAQARHLSVPPFKPIPNVNVPMSSRPMRLAAIPAFQALPASLARVGTVGPEVEAVAVPVAVVRAPVAFKNALNVATSNFQMPGALGASSSVPLSLRTLPVSNTQSASQALIMGHTVQTLSRASNISEEAILAALQARQQQLTVQTTSTVGISVPVQSTTTTTTTTTTPTPPPPPPRPINHLHKYPLTEASKVMNAPREYYPVGYDKNFDDNFVSRVELPDTSFHCGDQKHFPGLYADEDLGCMVFHVCALTEDGLIMKSFLCPESTLFDQTVLKCNWWFYVDCKASRRLYDSNIPVSKSYQLMKALAFFSSYKSQQGSNTNNSTDARQSDLS